MGTIVEQGVSVVISLRTEYLVDPLSIDTRIPRLSWIIDAGSARGVGQSAYQIEVASTPASRATGVRFERMEGDAAVFIVQSGRYSFVAR
jgi:alpha-L-rhamnosidase